MIYYTLFSIAVQCCCVMNHDCIILAVYVIILLPVILLIMERATGVLIVLIRLCV